METHDELERKMNGEDEAAARAAAAALANFHFIFSQERNAVRKKLKEVSAAYEDVISDPQGVDQAQAKRLETLKLSLKARLVTLDKRMDDFLGSRTPINPPSTEQVQRAKDLSAKVATLSARDVALEGALKALTDVLNEVLA